MSEKREANERKVGRRGKETLPEYVKQASMTNGRMMWVEKLKGCGIQMMERGRRRAQRC